MLLEFRRVLFRSYFSLIPDKTYFADAKEKIDHKEMVELIKANTSVGEYIEISDILSLDDYYKTDAHWKQENLIPIAKRLGEVMGFSVDESSFEKNEVKEYYGMYKNLWEEDIESEMLTYLENQHIKNAVVENFEKPEFKKVYDKDLLKSKTPYDVFLSVPTPFMVIENVLCEDDRDLIIFRDSF